MPDNTAFDWQRFWAPRDGSIDLSDGGFLTDPTHPPWAGAIQARQLADLSSYRALVLLGEPGIGKTTTLREEATRLAAKDAEGLMSIHVDLRAYSSESLLCERIFESPQFKSWAEGQSHLFLHLDSLDEALLRIDSIANLLADEFPRHQTERLSVRIACRTAVWPSTTLEPALRTIWGDSAVGVFELAPLRRCDVVAAATAVGIDADKFMEELYFTNVVPFANKPLTLNLLIALFTNEGSLPRRVADIYFRGCFKLCEEQNPSRRDTRRLGAYSAAQRLRVASRIAAATMFANRYAVWTGLESDGVPAEDVPLSALAGPHEQGNFPSFEVTEQSVREALDTGLFTSRGGDRMGWAHQGYAEFLAAQYLLTKEANTSNILKILLHPSGGLVPQLRVVAAWTASISKEVRQHLMQVDPMVLLQGDLTNWEESDLKNLTETMFAALDANRADDRSIGISFFYDKLKHSGLSSQLRPYILDKSKNLISRRIAIGVAKRCKLRDLQPDLLTLSLDETADPYLRGRAVDALSACGNDTVPELLRPLAKGEVGKDPQDEIRGYALEILWPKHMDARELFSLITLPNKGYVGSYVMFLTRILPQTLTADDLPIALEWATSFAADREEIDDFHWRSLADSIFIRAWRELEKADVIDRILTYVLTRLRAFHKLLGGTGRREIEGFYNDLNADVERRRRFLLAAMQRSLHAFDAHHLKGAQLLQRDDLEWLLGICPGAVGVDSQLNPETLCDMREIADLDDARNFEAVYHAALKWPLLWTSYRAVFDGIPIESEDAKYLQRTHEMMKHLAQENAPPPLTPPPAERVAAELDKFEAGDWAAWWRLNLELTLTPTSRTYGSDFDYSISAMPGWYDADPPTKVRILKAGAKYFTVGETSVSEWIAANPFTPRRNDLAAYRAMLLLREFDEPAYRAINPESWAKWAPVAVAILRTTTGSDEPKFHNEVVGDAVTKAPKEFVAAVRDVMRQERARTAAAAEQPQMTGASFFILRDLKGWWYSDPLKAGIFDELQNNSNSEDQFASILDTLLEAQFVPARKYAIAYLEDRALPNRQHAISAAVSLARHSPGESWNTIWQILNDDVSFGRAFFLKYSQRFRFEGSFLTHLTEDQLAQIYVYLEQLFPRASDPVQTAGHAHYAGPLESLIQLRDGMPQLIASRGTVASVAAIRWMIASLPNQTWLWYPLREAEQTMRMKTWSPLTPKELFGLFDHNNRLLVQSAEDLCELLVSALRKFESDLHGEQNPVRTLWDRQASGTTFRPIEEDALSDVVRLFLHRELVESGVIANREVEVARTPGAPIGTRTDIRVDAIRRMGSDGPFDALTALIETKGCWNRALFGALTDQLYGDYMVRLRAPVGIYLVGWFDKQKWDAADYRRRQAPDLTLQEAQLRLNDEAATIPPGYLVRTVVIDCHAP